MEIIFPINPLVQAASYKATAGDIGELKIVLLKRSKAGTSIQVREYSNVPRSIVYPWFYKKTASEILSYYAKNIRKKFTLLKIETAK